MDNRNVENVILVSSFVISKCLLYPHETNVFEDLLESACVAIRVSVCVQNTSFCQSAGGGISSHLVKAPVLFAMPAGLNYFELLTVQFVKIFYLAL